MFHEGGWAIWLIAIWIALSIAAVAGTARLLVLVWRRRARVGAPARVLAPFVAVVGLFGGGGTLWGLGTAFRAVAADGVDPPQKARYLAEGISEAMNCTAFGLLIWLPSAIALTLLAKKSAGAPPPGA